MVADCNFQVFGAHAWHFRFHFKRILSIDDIHAWMKHQIFPVSERSGGAFKITIEVFHHPFKNGIKWRKQEPATVVSNALKDFSSFYLQKCVYMKNQNNQYILIAYSLH